MNFLYPLGLLFAIFLPLVVLLYLLKLKRTDQTVASTLLWRKSLEDLKANTPFQKLKRNLLLFLQLLIIALLTLAVARPVLQLGGLKGQHFVVLIDNSASMSATDVRPSRLEDAKKKALQLVSDMGRGDRMMVVSFASRAQVLCPFEARKGALRDVIRRIEPTDSPTRVDDAIKVAQSAQEVQPNVELVILSDGRFDLPSDSPLGALNTRYLPIGTSAENTAVVDLVVRRDYGEQLHYEVLVGVRNCGQAAQDVYVELYGEGNLYAESPADATAVAAPANGNPERVLMDARRLNLAAGAVEQIVFSNPGYFPEKIEAKIDSPDILQTDNQAWAVIPRPRAMKILLVTAGNAYLERVLNLDPAATLSVIAPTAFVSPEGYDVVVFDHFAPPALGSGNFLFVNAIPPLPEWTSGDAVEFPLVVDWNRFHPLTRYLDLEDLAVQSAPNISTPAWAEKIVESRQTPLIATQEQDKLRVLVINFDLYRSNWPLRVSFPVFFTNALQWFSASKEASAFIKRTGDILTLEPPEILTQSVELTLPDGARRPITFTEDQPHYFGETDRAGIYRYAVEGKTTESYSVNLLSPEESTVQPVASLQTRTAEITGDPEALASNREIWRTLALIGFLVFCLEWYVYIKRARYAF